MLLRPARPDDVERVVALVESAYRGDASRAGWTTEADLLDGQRTDAAAVVAIVDQVVVAEDEGRLVGCCQLEHRGELAYFGMFAVDPSRQGAGIGDALLAEAGRQATAWACERLEMTVIAQRGDLIAWYERRGFRRTGEQRPFPYGDERFGVPKRPDLVFDVLTKDLSAPTA